MDAKRIKQLAEVLALGSGKNLGMQHDGATPFPAIKDIEEAIKLASEILCPGIFCVPARSATASTLGVERKLRRLSRLLMQLTDCALAHGEDAKRTKRKSGVSLHAKETTHSFFEQLPQVARMLTQDVDAAYLGDPAAKSRHEVIYSYPGFRAVISYRLARVLHKLEVPLLPRAITELAHSKTGIDIHPGAEIGHRFFIDHGTGVVIGETCEIGDNVKLYQGVTLGALSFPRDELGALKRGQKRHPTLEDDVVVYANATILGGETTVGRGSVIGSSVWLGQSVAPHSIVTTEKAILKIRSPAGPGGTLGR